MPDLEDVISFVVRELPGRYGRWLNYPDESPGCALDPLACKHVVKWDAPYELRKLIVSWGRNVTGMPLDDYAQTTHHFLNLTADVPDATWDAADFTSVESKFDTFWNAIKDRYAADTILKQYDWRKDGPAFRPHSPAPDGLLSPVVRSVSRSLAGTDAANGMLPPQMAVTVTEVTSARFTAHDVEGVGDQVRNRWGRFYLPAPSIAQCGNGRLWATPRDDIADAAAAFYNACVAADLIPVMYSPTTGSCWSIDELHVDDIYDVIRSRRWRTATSRSPRPITPP